MCFRCDKQTSGVCCSCVIKSGELRCSVYDNLTLEMSTDPTWTAYKSRKRDASCAAPSNSHFCKATLRLSVSHFSLIFYDVHLVSNLVLCYLASCMIFQKSMRCHRNPAKFPENVLVLVRTDFSKKWSKVVILGPS